MTIAGKTLLVTGANRGIGQALVQEALRRDAGLVYAATRQPPTECDARVVPLRVDVTDPAQIRVAAEQVAQLDILINNAGVGLYDDLSDQTALETHLSVNLFGTFAVTQAFLPRLIESRGAIVNVLSIAAVAALPFIPAYSISKAAAFALTQSHRALLAKHDVKVHAVLAGPVDTDMSRDLHVPKVSAAHVANEIFDGVGAGDDDIFPDPMLQPLAEEWRTGQIKALERQYASVVAWVN